ncbi:MAG: alkaline phosphatase [Thermoguttaceae bacterium]|nr:alkaline phosphatase [Thermoguttaceae bacterium]
MNCDCQYSPGCRGFAGSLTLALALLASASAAFAAEPTEAGPSPIGAAHVILVGFDGMGSKYMDWDKVPVLKRLRDEGAWTENCMSVLPSDSIPNWSSNFMGASPNVHGYRENLNINGSLLIEPESPAPDCLSDKGKFPCMYRQLKRYRPDARTMFVGGWIGITNYIETSDVDDLFETSNNEEAFNFFMEGLKENPTLACIVFGEPDETGHVHGWGSPEYQEVSYQMDCYLGKIIEYLQSNDRFKDTVLITMADHGGVNFSKKVHYHGDRVYEDILTPRIFYGCGVKPGQIEDLVMGFDLAPTVAWVLGIPQSSFWRGKPNVAAFGFDPEQTYQLQPPADK